MQATTLNQQLLEEEREQLLSEVQERMTLSGQLEPILADNNTAAGRLWDMSAGQLKRGDYQLIVKYGEFLNEQPELKRPAEQLGRSGSQINTAQRCADGNLPHRCANRRRFLSRLMVCNKAMIFYVSCRQNWRH